MVVAIRQIFPCLFNPVQNSDVRYLRDSTNAAHPHAVDIHLQTQAFHIVAVASEFVLVEELPFAIDTNIVLFSLAMPVFANMRAATFRTFHPCHSPVEPLIQDLIISQRRAWKQEVHLWIYQRRF